MTSDLFHKLTVIFDWSEWLQVFANQRYGENPQNIASAPLADCISLITTIVRNDRFFDGIVRQCASDGTIDALLQRLGALCRQGVIMTLMPFSVISMVSMPNCRLC